MTFQRVPVIHLHALFQWVLDKFCSIGVAGTFIEQNVSKEVDIVGKSAFGVREKFVVPLSAYFPIAGRDVLPEGMEGVRGKFDLRNIIPATRKNENSFLH